MVAEDRRVEGYKNLQRGRPDSGDVSRLRNGIARRDAAEDAVAELLIGDPMVGLKTTWEKTTFAIDILMGKWLRSGGLPHRELLDALKEFRQQTKTVTEWIRDEGLAAETDNFISDWVRTINGDEVVKREAGEDPQLVLVRVHDKLTRGTNRLVDKWGRSKDYPQRTLVEVMSELRQTAQAVAEYRRSIGSSSESERFFATVETRLAEAHLEEGVRSYSPAA